MGEVITSVLNLSAALFLVALNGLFVAAEFAFVRLRSTRVDMMVSEGRAAAGIVREATRNLDSYLAVCQLGITISSLGLGALGEPAIAALIEPLLEPLGISEGTLHLIAFVVAFGIITFLHVVFGELAAKSFAIARPEGTSQFVALPMRFFYYAFWPGIWVFNGTANAFVRMFGIPPPSEAEDAHSEEELGVIIGQSTEQGVLTEGEEGMLRAVIGLEDTRAREIMVPRPDVVSLPASMSLGELFSVTADGGYTRYPIHEDDYPDRVIGAVHVGDVLGAIKAAGNLEEADATARDLVREVLTVPESRRIDGILRDFQKTGSQMAVVIDEWGTFEGIILVEDILEEIVGEIRDELDEEEPQVREQDGSYVVDGSLTIRDANEVLGTDFTSEYFDTIGGLVLECLGRPPEVGDEVSAGGHTLRVDEVDGPRVVQVTVRRSDA